MIEITILLLSSILVYFQIEAPFAIADHKRDLIVVSGKGAISDWKSSELGDCIDGIRKYDVGGCCI